MSLLEPERHSTTKASIAIIGGGAAGLSAAIWLARYLHDLVLIDSGDPRNWETRGVNGFLGLPGVRPAELRGRGRDELRRYPNAHLVDGCVNTIRCAGEDEFRLTLQSGDVIVAQRVLLAYGLRDVWPDVEGLEHVYGSAAHVCPDCDGFDARDSRIAVIGNGRKAVGMALNLTTWSQDIRICTNGEPADLTDEYREKLDANGIVVSESRIARIRAQDGDLNALEFEDGSPPYTCAHIFFKLGQYLADDLAVQLGCERDEEGHLVIDSAYHTSVRNVWAAGDVVPGPQLAVAAAADGAMAALSIHKSLVPEHRRLG